MVPTFLSQGRRWEFSWGLSFRALWILPRIGVSFNMLFGGVWVSTSSKPKPQCLQWERNPLLHAAHSHLPDAGQPGLPWGHHREWTVHLKSFPCLFVYLRPWNTTLCLYSFTFWQVSSTLSFSKGFSSIFADCDPQIYRASFAPGIFRILFQFRAVANTTTCFLFY